VITDGSGEAVCDADAATPVLDGFPVGFFSGSSPEHE
jgi:hypothetical protein